MVAVALVALSEPASADLAATANDSHTVNNNGVSGAAKNAPPDTVSIIDVSAYPPKVVATVEAPASVVGPPMSIAIAKDESYAIVTAATKLDPQNPDKIVPDNRVTVIDLKASPPKAVQQMTAGDGAAGVSISPDGTLALVANRTEGTVSVFFDQGQAPRADRQARSRQPEIISELGRFPAGRQDRSVDPRRRQHDQCAAYRRHQGDRSTSAR